jgi:endogenous inhibitor of DNA gyrase (YacG/DUF329 family)
MEKKMALAGVACPKCRKPVKWEGNDYRPFCSERCRLLDLGAWVEEGYRIPASIGITTAEEDKNNE